MDLQRTLRRNVEYEGFEFYGGNRVRVKLSPAEENTGIVFQTLRGDVKANLKNARQSRSSILLQDGMARVIHVEHFLAALFAYGIDNAVVKLTREPTKSFKTLQALGLATDIEVVPISHDRELTLCKKIEEAGVENQSLFRRYLTVQAFNTERLNFYEIKEGLVMKTTTYYPQIGEQVAEFRITPESFRDELSQSRAYAKHLPVWAPKWLGSLCASFLYPTFGIGHGFSEENVFLPPRNLYQWNSREILPQEIARHTIVDRLGAIALLSGRLDKTKVCARFSGHANDIKVLRSLSLEDF